MNPLNVIVTAAGVHKAAIISGPSHNYLGLSFTQFQPDSIRIIKIDKQGLPSLIQEDRLIEAVQRGVRASLEASQKPYFVERVEYVSDDTPSYDAYAELAAILFKEFQRRMHVEAEGPRARQ